MPLTGSLFDPKLTEMKLRRPNLGPTLGFSNAQNRAYIKLKIQDDDTIILEFSGRQIQLIDRKLYAAVPETAIQSDKRLRRMLNGNHEIAKRDGLETLVTLNETSYESSLHGKATTRLDRYSFIITITKSESEVYYVVEGMYIP